MHKLQPLKEQLPQVCGDDEHPKSLNDQASQMDGVPGVKSALKAATGPWSTLQLVFER